MGGKYIEEVEHIEGSEHTGGKYMSTQQTVKNIM